MKIKLVLDQRIKSNPTKIITLEGFFLQSALIIRVICHKKGILKTRKIFFGISQRWRYSRWDMAGLKSQKQNKAIKLFGSNVYLFLSMWLRPAAYGQKQLEAPRELRATLMMGTMGLKTPEPGMKVRGSTRHRTDRAAKGTRPRSSRQPRGTSCSRPVPNGFINTTSGSRISNVKKCLEPMKNFTSCTTQTGHTL